MSLISISLGLEAFEYGDVTLCLCFAVKLGGVDSPGEGHYVIKLLTDHEGKEPRVLAIVGDVIRLCDAVEDHCGCDEAGENIALMTLRKEIGNKHAADYSRAVLAVPADEQGIEGLDRIISVFLVEELGKLDAEARVVALELDAEGSGGVDGGENVLKKRDLLVCALDVDPGKLGRGL